MLNDTQQTQILKFIAREELAELTKTLVDIPSPTGNEREIGEFIAAWYVKNDIKATLQVIEPNRVNAVGVLEGRGQGVSLMINGHMDTSYTGTEEDSVLCRTLEPASDLKGAGHLLTDSLSGTCQSPGTFPPFRF